MKPHISVVIPAFNEEKQILTCLTSLKTQTLSPDQYEIIVVDNNSTDNTADIAKQAGVRVVQCTQKGVAAARQYGVTQASADIIAFTDADSHVPNEWLSKINLKMKDKTLLVLGGKVMPDTKDRVTLFLYEVADRLILVQQLLGKVLPWGINLAVRRDALETIGGFDKQIASAEDWDVALRIQKQFGKKSALYVSDIIAYTSNRKQEDKKIFLKYMWDGVVNYTNFVLLGRRKLRGMMTVR